MTELETRVCLCGCGGVFRVRPNSASRFASVTHRPDYSPVAFGREITLHELMKIKRWLNDICPEDDEEKKEDIG